jgi:hypothetical protein
VGFKNFSKIPTILQILKKSFIISLTPHKRPKKQSKIKTTEKRCLIK